MTPAEQRRHRTGTLLVVAQFTLIGLVLLPVGPAIGSGQLRPVGIALLVAGAVVGVLALLAMGSDTRVHPVPGQGASLHRNGIYAWIRHPMYAAVLLACAGVTVSTGRVLAIAAFVALAAVLHAKARFEDSLLDARFGWEFAVYAQRVPALVPQPWRSRRA